MPKAGKSIFLGLLIAISFNSFSQQRNVDSLLTLLKKDKEDTTKIMHLNELGSELMYDAVDTGVILGIQALNLAKKISTSANEQVATRAKKGMIASFNLLGSCSFVQSDNIRSLDYFLKALKISEEIKDKKGIAGLTGNIASVYHNQGDLPKALDYNMKALKLFEELVNDVDENLAKTGRNGVPTTLGNIGLIYSDMGDYPKGLDYYFKALKKDEDMLQEAKRDQNAELILKTTKGMAKRIGNIGLLYYKQGEFSKALDHYVKAMKVDEEVGNKSGIARNLGNIGIVYYRQDKYEQAIEYYLKALKLDRETANKSGIAKRLGNIGNVYKDLGDGTANEKEQKLSYEKALSYYTDAQKLFEELDLKLNSALNMANIGALYTSMGRYKEAYTNLYLALGVSSEIGVLDNVKDNYEYLSKLYERSTVPLLDTLGGKILNKEQMRSRALYYYKRAIVIRDTIFSEENKKQLVQKEMNFEFEKKEAAVKTEQAKKDLQITEEKQRQQLIIKCVSFGIILVLMLALVILRSLRQNQKKNKIITEQKEIVEKQKELVEEKQKEILDSIQYAKRIQTALMTNEKYIEKSLNKLSNNRI